MKLLRKLDLNPTTLCRRLNRPTFRVNLKRKIIIHPFFIRRHTFSFHIERKRRRSELGQCHILGQVGDFIIHRRCGEPDGEYFDHFSGGILRVFEMQRRVRRNRIYLISLTVFVRRVIVVRIEQMKRIFEKSGLCLDVRVGNVVKYQVELRRDLVVLLESVDLDFIVQD